MGIPGKDNLSPHYEYGAGTDRPVTGQSGCPECGKGSPYHLADGRLQCRNCRKKYTANPHKRRLSGYLRKEIGRLFWLMIPAETGSRILGIDRKTLQDYYTSVRRGIARERQRMLARMIDNPGHRPDVPDLFDRELLVFIAFLLRQEVYLLLPGESAAALPGPGLAVYAASRHAFERKDLKNFYLHPISAAEPAQRGEAERLHAFWLFARSRLGKYRGGIRRNFSLFLREMEFRFNCREETEGMHLIAEFLRPARRVVHANKTKSSEEQS